MPRTLVYLSVSPLFSCTCVPIEFTSYLVLLVFYSFFTACLFCYHRLVLIVTLYWVLLVWTIVSAVSDVIFILWRIK